MKIRLSVLSAIAASTLLFSSLPTCAAEAVPAVGTHRLWQWLGLSSGCADARDGRIYRGGTRRYAPCPHEQICPERPSPAQPGEGARPGETPETQPPGEKAPAESAAGESALPPSNALASNYGATSGPLSSAPNMIGDRFGGGMVSSRIVRSFRFDNLSADFSPYPNYFTVNAVGTRVALNQFIPNGSLNNAPVLDYNDAASRLGGPPLASVPAGGMLVGGVTTTPDNDIFTSQFDVAYDVNVPSPSGGVVGRLKIADDTSPMPRDRVIFDYNYFDAVPLFPGGVAVNRFTPGFEKTLFDGWMSFEMKLPMATTLDSTIVQDGVTNTSNGEFGNMLLTWKSLVMLRENWALSGGLSVAPPTAGDVRVVAADGTPLLQVANRATHLGPFLGFLWTPSDRCFAQGFLQYDVAANGNPVSVNESVTGRELSSVGKICDTTFQYLDVGVGYWMYRGHERFRRLTGWACTAEMHWNHSLQEADVVQAGNWRIGDFASTIESFNLTLGTHLEFFDRTTVTFGYSVPLGGGLDREYDGEFRLMVNRRFGPQNRLTRSTF
ncbi:MAG: hypothetical protein IT426_16175 [Pirellulales bacterium]|nr:hypothetical protein [Pirellulales bacterium]